MPPLCRVRLTVYSCTPHADAKTARLKAAVEDRGGTWQDVAAMPEPALADKIRADGIHILVELAGHTALNWLGVMALQPAPVQVCVLGLGTFGTA